MEKSTHSERLRVALAMRKACADKCESMSTHQPMADGYRASNDRERVMAGAIANIDPLDIIAQLDDYPAPDPIEQEAFERAAVLEHFPVNKRDNGEYFHPITQRLYKVWKMALNYNEGK